MRINFDMDGTLADFYGVENWLDYLLDSQPYPYEVAKPMLSMCSLAKRLHKLQNAGYEIAIISWLSKNGSDEYNKKVIKSKEKWLKKHLPSVKWDEITIVTYGTPKEAFCFSNEDILFDDEERNRENWTGKAYDVNQILEILKSL